MADSVTRTLLVDDQVLYREALRGLIERWPEYQVVGEASNGHEALRLASACHPDLILMDITMPLMDGVESTRAILEAQPDVTVVMLTVESDKDLVLDALQAGARGYMLKDTPARKLRDRLRSILQGEMSLSESITAPVVEELNRMRARMGASSQVGIPSPEHLSDREKDILRLVAQGKSNEEIAAELYLSVGTVKKQLSSLMLRLCLENRVQAAVYAVKAGLDR
ncbi:MAG: response regulator transcription factor [Eggerthellaceae bacterium]|nr:response regulator transcription factor [Eggerthellaceae bacterium]